MSVVAGRVYKDKIVVAADSIVVRGWSKKTNFSKLEQINGMIIGSSGTAEELSLMFRFAQTHKPECPTEKEVLAFIVEFATWKKDFNGNSNIDNTYLIAVDEYLFSVEGMFVNEVKDYEAIGAGRDFANAALYLGHTPEEAAKVACELSCYVAEPIVKYEMKI